MPAVTVITGKATNKDCPLFKDPVQACVCMVLLSNEKLSVQVVSVVVPKFCKVMEGVKVFAQSIPFGAKIDNTPASTACGGRGSIPMSAS